MSAVADAMKHFVGYFRRLSGDEKGEAQVFCDRLFQAFGHQGYKEAGATLEYRVKSRGKGTKYADLTWKPRVLIEMKSRGEKLQQHYTQAFEYWIQLVPDRPKYVILCNFDEFWVYDLNQQLNEPVDKLKTEELPERYPSLNFLFPDERKPQFGNDLVAVTRKAAALVANTFNSLVRRGESRERAQRFVLQCVVAMFAEDTELLQPRGLFTELIEDCCKGGSSYDLIGGLFRQMNSPIEARGGRFKDVRYFNGGLFRTIDPIELSADELALLFQAAQKENWGKVQPHIFGTIFQDSMGKEERHAFGAHFTSEADIQKVMLPTIIRPWRARIEAAKSLRDHKDLLAEIRTFRVLDPACGSGNFLYVAYRELRRLELALMAKAHGLFKTAREDIGTRPHVSTQQFFGIDKNAFAVELAKVTLMLAKELSLDEAHDWIDQTQSVLPFDFDEALPLDNLDQNILCADALFTAWPEAEAVIGNPPYLDARKITLEHGDAYVRSIRQAFAEVPGRADLCVYWFRKTHDHLRPGKRAGLVGTNTIRQNYSREGGLDYIVGHGGTITDAVSTQVWSGDADVHVSIVNWINGEEPGPKRLMLQRGDSVDSPWETYTQDRINSALSPGFDVSAAARLEANARSTACFEGQQPGHTGFRVSAAEAAALAAKGCGSVLHPYLVGTDLLSGNFTRSPEFIIDFGERDKFEADSYGAALDVVRQRVLPDWQKNADDERVKKGKETGEHQNRLKKWWQLKRQRQALMAAIAPLSRFAVCVRHTKRPIFEFLSSRIRPDSSFTAFPLADDYSFGVLQSGIHWEWFLARCSTIKADYRYTSDTVFDSFPWPQSPTLAQAKAVAKLAVELRALRQEVMVRRGLSRRELYRSLDEPGETPLDSLQDKLDAAVRAAYGMKARQDPLEALLVLNLRMAKDEQEGQTITGPGLPPCVTDPHPFVTSDCVSAPTYG